MIQIKAPVANLSLPIPYETAPSVVDSSLAAMALIKRQVVRAKTRNTSSARR
jgi:hypothetical protein